MREGSRILEEATTIQVTKETKRKLINIKNNKGYKTLEEVILKKCKL